MRKHSSLALRLARAAMLTLLATCTPRDAMWTVVTPAADSSGAPVRIVGVVKYVGLEGGVYTIRGDDSVTYNPTNLPAQFQKDGLLIEAEGRRRDDMMGIHQVGPMVQLERVRVRESGS